MLIESFKQELWNYVEIRRRGFLSDAVNYIKLQNFDTQIGNGERLFNDFKWLLFLESLDTFHLSFLNLNPRLFSRIKAVLNAQVNFSSKALLINVLEQDIFSFLTPLEKNNTADLLMSFSDVALNYKTGDLNDIWQTDPEKWVIETLQKMPDFNQKNVLPWALGKVLTKLGYYCAFSLATARAFFSYSQKDLDEPAELYPRWLESLSGLPKVDCYLMEIIGDVCFANLYHHNISPDLVGSKIKQAFKWGDVGGKILDRKEEFVSNKDLIDFIYNHRKSAENITKNDVKKLFYNLDNDFRPLSEHQDKYDWVSFWRGANLFFKRYWRFKDKNSQKMEGIVLDTPMNVDSWFRGILPTRYQESLWCVLLNNKNVLQGFHEVSRGTVNQTIAHPREVFSVAIERRATSVILLHNHPSGDPTPSANDLETTERMRESGKILGIRLLDHVIIGKKNSYSFNEGIFESKNPI